MEKEEVLREGGESPRVLREEEGQESIVKESQVRVCMVVKVRRYQTRNDLTRDSLFSNFLE